MLEKQNLLDVAEAAALRAASYVRAVDKPSDPSAWTQKGYNDFVTQVDRESERLIAETLLRAVPDSVVLGEELTPEAMARGLVWIVDPLDGTINYLHGYPAYAVSIGAVAEGALVAGIVVDIERDVVYKAVAGGGAWTGERQLKVSSVSDTSVALLGTGFPFKVPELLPTYLHQFSNLLRSTSGIRRTGSAALDLVDVALGRLDGFWELSLAPWDVAAGTLIVREAGGVVTDLQGSEDVLRHNSVVAGSRPIHAWLLEALKGAG